MSRSDVYLVSAKQYGDEKGQDNRAYQATETSLSYGSANGLDNAESNKKMPDRPYRGMGKEELLHFSTQPFWKRLRMACIAVVLIGWLALIITVVALVLVYPRCREAGARSWWQKQTVYRIYVPSFKDSNDDGIGDLKGIESRLDYIQDLGFNVISLSPFYSGESTGTSVTTAVFKAGNDMAITDHKTVGEVYGTLADFDNLIAAAHDKGMFVVLDFVPNHTSKTHPWFATSAGSPAGEKRNYYMWGGTGSSQPNNWKNHYGGSAWTNDTGGRDEWYLHQYEAGTADLNLRSALVRQELEDILVFWLDREVDGFNIRDTASLYEDYDLRDDPVVPVGSSTSGDYADYDHVHSSNQPEVYGLMEQWRILVRNNNKTHTEKLLMADIDGGLNTARLYSYCDRSGVQMPLNRHALGMATTCNGQCVADYVDGWMANVPGGKWANWMMGDEDAERFASRFNDSIKFTEAFTILTYLLPGTPVAYAGDELGMVDTGSSVSSPWSRDQPSRSIMHWGDGDFCNSTCTGWTSVGDLHANSGGLAGLIKNLSALRDEPSFVVGDYARALRNEHIFSFVREFDGETGYLVAINFSPNKVTGDFVDSHATIQSEGVVVLVHGADYEVEDEVDLSSLEIGPYGGIVASWDYVAKEL